MIQCNNTAIGPMPPVVGTQTTAVVLGDEGKREHSLLPKTEIMEDEESCSYETSSCHVTTRYPTTRYCGIPRQHRFKSHVILVNLMKIYTSVDSD